MNSKIIIIFIILFFSMQNTTAIPITASDTIQYSSDNAQSSTSGTYVLLKELIMDDPYTGSWNISFDMRSNNDQQTTLAYGRIYKNNVAYGIERMTTSFEFVTFSQTFSAITINAGDKIQIYVKTDESPSYSSRIMNFRIMFDPPTWFVATGKVTYEDTDNSTHNLPNATVYYNSTLNDLTDSNGDYSISGIPNGVRTLTASKSLAFNTQTGTTSDSSPIKNFLLKYSKPNMGDPYISSRDTITGSFSHNFKVLHLWEAPSYVWGVYRYEDLNGTPADKDYFKACTYYSGTLFECERVAGRSYTFHFQYTDIYNDALAAWHPTLTGHRNFTTGLLYVNQNSTGEGGTIRQITFNQNMTAEEKEKAIKNNFWDYLFITLILIVMVVIGGINDRSRR